MKKPLLLILYHHRGEYPLREAISSHLYCWRHYSRYQTIYINSAFDVDWNRLKEMPIAGIILHTSFCALRWRNPVLLYQGELSQFLQASSAVKLAFPQDEFTHSGQLCDLISHLGVKHIFSCAAASEWQAIYADINLDQISIETVLTGYIDDPLLEISKAYARPLANRQKFLGYRAWNAAPSLGRHGQMKVEIAQEFQKAALQRGIGAIDISLRDQDKLLGKNWYKFLGDCRGVLGVEGGASILDRNGELQRKVADYMQQNPDADYDQIAQTCLADVPQSLALFCLSPRHLEASALQTCQLLVEGKYNDLLRADQHYIKVEKDFSNVKDCLEQLRDDRLVQQITERSFEEVTLNPKNHYRNFVQRTEKRFLPFGFDGNPDIHVLASDQLLFFQKQEEVNWRRVRIEHHMRRHKRLLTPMRTVLGPIYHFMRRLFH